MICAQREVIIASVPRGAVHDLSGLFLGDREGCALMPGDG